MSGIIHSLLQNKVLWITILAWAIAQLTKVLLGIIREKRFNFRWFVGTGGMPSSHASGASALAVITGIEYGFDSGVFALAAVFAFVTMFDAQGVRRSAGKQAEILNKIMEDIYWQGRIQEKRLWELIGHTSTQVIIGCIIGVLTALAFQ